MRVALAKAVRQGLVHRNVAALADPPRVQQKHYEPLTVEEAGRLLAAVRGHRLEALVVLALATGLRQGELLGLRWDDVASDCSAVTVRNSLQRIRGQGLQLVPPKTDRSRRTVPLPASAAAVVRAHRDRQVFEQQRAGSEWYDAGAGGFVFCTVIGRPLDASTSGGVWWRGIRAKAGLERVRFHDLRHAAASFLLAEGVGLREVMEQLGHSSIALTANVYAHVLPHVLEESARKLDRVLVAAAAAYPPHAD
jgi:integrase